MSAKIKLLLLGFIALIVLFCSTQPSQLPTPLLIAPFLLLFVLLRSIIMIALAKKAVVSHKFKRLATLAAAFPIVLLAMQSVGQLTIRDVTMIALFFGIAYFYLARTATSAA